MHQTHHLLYNGDRYDILLSQSAGFECILYFPGDREGPGTELAWHELPYEVREQLEKLNQQND